MYIFIFSYFSKQLLMFDMSISKKINKYIEDINNFKVQHELSLNDEVIINPQKSDVLCIEFKKHNLHYSINLKNFLKINNKKINDKSLIGVITGFSFDRSIVQVSFNNSNANTHKNIHDVYWFYYDNLLPVLKEVQNVNLKKEEKQHEKLNGGSTLKNITNKKVKNTMKNTKSVCLCKKKIKKATTTKQQLEALKQNALENSSDIFGNKIEKYPINPMESIGDILSSFQFIGNDEMQQSNSSKCVKCTLGNSPKNTKKCNKRRQSGGNKKYEFSSTEMNKNLQAITYIFIKLLQLLVKNPIFKLCYYVVINVIYKFILSFKNIISTFQNINENSYSKLLFIQLTAPICISTEYFISTNLIYKITDKIKIFMNNIDVSTITHITRYLIDISKRMTKLIEDTCYARGQMLIPDYEKSYDVSI